MKKKLHVLLGFIAWALPATLLVLYQSSVLTIKIYDISVNFVYLFLAVSMVLKPSYKTLIVVFYTGVLVDSVSENYFCFYTISFSASLFPLALAENRFDTNFVLPLFLLLIFAVTALKVLIETLFLSILYNFSLAILFIKREGILEIVVVSLLSIFVYLVILLLREMKNKGLAYLRVL